MSTELWSMERARLPTSSSPSPSTKSTLDQLWRAWPPAAGRFGASAQTILHQGMLSVSCPYVRFSVSYLSRLRYVEWRLPVFFVASPSSLLPTPGRGAQKKNQGGRKVRKDERGRGAEQAQTRRRWPGGGRPRGDGVERAQTATHCN